MPKKKKAAGKHNSSATRSAPRTAHYDIDFIRSACRGRCADILSRVFGIPSDILDGNHHACPKCGGTDRFRLIDEEAGAVLCNQCARSGIGDIFASAEWYSGKKFADVLKLIADHLGIEPSESASGSGYKSNGHATGSHDNADPAENLTFQPWDESTELLAALWTLTKPPITVAAVRAVGGQVARYRDQYTVIALPIHGESLGRDGAKPVGWCLYNITGGNLPKWKRAKPGQPLQPPEWVKVKLTHGSQPGIIADIARLAAAAEIWKVEGPSDLLGFLSIATLPADVAALTNANGSKENPLPFLLPLFTARRARVIHDADKPGQEGSLTWARAIASQASECRLVRLPYEIVENHGKDLRDWLIEEAAIG